MQDIFRPTYDEMHYAYMCIADAVIANGDIPTLIIALSRGGLFGGVALSHRLNIPLRVVNYSSKSGKGDDRNHDNVLPFIEAQTILIVDDLADTGYSLAEVSLYYQSQGNVVYTAVYIDKQSLPPIIETDYAFHEQPGAQQWVIFPYESSDV